jgi:deoxyribodipyrimidine photo-lyase
MISLINMINIFIFRRDFRIFDNTSLNLLKKTYPHMKILPIFIFNKNQIESSKNPYFSSNSFEFMCDSLCEIPSLNCYLTTDDLLILKNLQSKFKINAIAFNLDFTPFAIKRDKIISDWCKSQNIIIIHHEDYTLHKLGTICKDNGKPYQKFTPFYNKGLLIKPSSIINENFEFIKDSSTNLNPQSLIKKRNPNIKVKGGRVNALLILKKLKDGVFDNYDQDREYPFLDKTTKLSAYIKFGCLSIREIYYSLPLKHGIIRELFWKDFYANISYFFPYVFGNSFIKKYSNIKWDNNEELFEKWKEGKTGFPIIDASMRQLNKTGWLHNRCRMLVASFLVKNLFIDWRLGEKYFASKLVDYDPSSNNGGWQWCASTGTDSQPYFRIFSPTLQMKKYDKDCQYIKKWVEELSNVDNKIILNWETKQISINYPKPIIDFSKTSKRFKYSLSSL